MLKLSCFAKNPVLPLLVPVFIWNRLTLKTGPGRISHGFWLKRRPLEPYFKILPAPSSRKNRSEKLSCFEFYPVRPLRALYFHFSETGQFRIRNGQFRLLSPVFVLVRESTSTESHRELILQTHNVSNVPHKIKNRSKGSMQTKTKIP